MEKEENNICFFNSCKAWGGGEKWHYDIAVRLLNKNHNIILVTNNNSELYYKAVNSNIPTISIKISNFSFLNPFKILKISRLFKNHLINTVILNLPSDLKAAGVAAKLAGVNNIIYRRGSAIPIKNSFLNRFLFKKIITQVIVNSNETKNTLNANNPNMIDEKKVKLVYNGIDLKKYDKTTSKIYTKANNEIILGSAGRLSKQKAQKYLIEIAKKLKSKNINFKLLIAGDGELNNELRTYAKKLQVENEVVFLGFVENIKTFMNSIDIFLLTSLWEGFGYVIVEAMACKKPTVAFNVSSNPEIIADKETGFLIDDFNIDEFTDKIDLLINDNELREKFGNKAREIVEKRFEIDNTVKQIEQILY
ncbi:MAG: glycosyltransferase family 1 protein [Bacteroidetes bacterium]|nr:MAG: glycosyltransferase family 1 protein [Bacteroidota bacterium]